MRKRARARVGSGVRGLDLFNNGRKRETKRMKEVLSSVVIVILG